MKQWIFLLFVLIVATASAQSGQDKFRPNTIIFKVTPGYEGFCSDGEILVPALNERIAELGAVKLFRKFPRIPVSDPRSTDVAPDPRVPDLSMVYELQYSSNMPVPKAVNFLKGSGLCAYAEPAYIQEVCLVPSDVRVGDQWHLPIISAFDAWDVNTGSADITIAIVDTGVDWDHPDLVNSIQYNFADPVDGLDNDSNGYVDDFRGWNFYDNNNDPDERSWSHGTHVAGLAGATANNNYGVVGTGYNCRILPVKTGDRLEITHGYEGVVYAADQGARVINCSWGGRTYSAFGEEAIRYAVFKKECVVTAGAGNDNRDTDFYPASLPFVISVGATDSLDLKAEFSNFGYSIDLLAPGARTFSTENDTLEFESGTSMSAPIVAGAAALVIAEFDDLDPLQVAERIKNTTDDIYGVGTNGDFRDKLGSGRLNMYEALRTTEIGPAVQIGEHIITDNADEIYVVGDLIEVGIELVNFLDATENLTVTLRSLSPNVMVLDSLWQTPALATKGRINNFNSPFLLEVTSFSEYREKVALEVQVTDGTYTQKRFLEFSVNQDYVNLNVNHISTSVSSQGNFGFVNDALNLGLGFSYDNESNMLYEGGLMIGYEDDIGIRVADRVRNDAGTDQDFGVTEVITEEATSSRAEFLAFGSFDDEPAILDGIGLKVEQRAMASAAFGQEDFVVMEYTITNQSGADIPELYVGLFADWDIINANRNRALTQQGRNMGYVHFVGDEELSAGMQLLSSFPFYSYMIDNETISGGGVNLFDDGYSTLDKYTTLSSSRYSAGTQLTGNDVIQVVSAGNIVLRDGQSVTVAFSLFAGRSQEQVIAAADSAFKWYNGFLPGENVYKPFQFVNLSPNPAQEQCLIEFDLQEADELSFMLIDAKGIPVGELLTQSFFQGRNSQFLDIPPVNSGTYVLQVEGSNFSRRFLLQVIKTD